MEHTITTCFIEEALRITENAFIQGANKTSIEAIPPTADKNENCEDGGLYKLTVAGITAEEFKIACKADEAK